MLLPHPVMLEFIRKTFIKSHLRKKILVVNANRTLACSVKPDEIPLAHVRCKEDKGWKKAILFVGPTGVIGKVIRI